MSCLEACAERKKGKRGSKESRRDMSLLSNWVYRHVNNSSHLSP